MATTTHGCIVLLVVVVGVVALTASARPPLGFSTLQTSRSMHDRQHRRQVDAPTASRPGVQNCTEYWFTQRIDHFNWDLPTGGVKTFQQRYCSDCVALDTSTLDWSIDWSID
jgi:hypothetical protein